MRPKIIGPAILASMLVVWLMFVQAAHSQSSPRRIEVTAKRFEFTPGESTWKGGEPAVLVLKSTDVPRGIRFQELCIEAKAGKGKTTEITFTPDKIAHSLAAALCSAVLAVGLWC